MNSIAPAYSGSLGRMPVSARRVLAVLWEHRDYRTGFTHPNWKTIGIEAGIGRAQGAYSRRSVARAVAWLREHWLIATQRSGPGALTYQILRRSLDAPLMSWVRSVKLREAFDRWMHRVAAAGRIVAPLVRVARGVMRGPTAGNRSGPEAPETELCATEPGRSSPSPRGTCAAPQRPLWNLSEIRTEAHSAPVAGGEYMARNADTHGLRPASAEREGCTGCTPERGNRAEQPPIGRAEARPGGDSGQRRERTAAAAPDSPPKLALQPGDAARRDATRGPVPRSESPWWWLRTRSERKRAEADEAARQRAEVNEFSRRRRLAADLQRHEAAKSAFAAWFGRGGPHVEAFIARMRGADPQLNAALAAGTGVVPRLFVLFSLHRPDQETAR